LQFSYLLQKEKIAKAEQMIQRKKRFWGKRFAIHAEITASMGANLSSQRIPKSKRRLLANHMLS
jgi:hypothetical protein